MTVALRVYGAPGCTVPASLVPLSKKRVRLCTKPPKRPRTPRGGSSRPGQSSKRPAPLSSEAQKRCGGPSGKSAGRRANRSAGHGRDLGEAGLEAEELSVQVADLRARRARDAQRAAELEELRPGLEAAAAEAGGAGFVGTRRP